MFFLAKTLQAVGVISVGFGLYFGMIQDADMWRELQFTVSGVAIFYVGRLLEQRV